MYSRFFFFTWDQLFKLRITGLDKTPCCSSKFRDRYSRSTLWLWRVIALKKEKNIGIKSDVFFVQLPDLMVQREIMSLKPGEWCVQPC